jgi:hypothetical protein
LDPFRSSHEPAFARRPQAELDAGFLNGPTKLTPKPRLQVRRNPPVAGVLWQGGLCFYALPSCMIKADFVSGRLFVRLPGHLRSTDPNKRQLRRSVATLA